MTTKELTNLLKGELTNEIANYIKSENPFPEAMINWLAELVLLHHVPFNNLIADENLLPNESLRLFYLDKNWTNAMLDGALSIGIHSERDILLQQAMNDIIRTETNKKLATDSTIQLGTIAGLIIRSSIVSNYKGLEITGFEHNKIPIKTLRIERLATNILFVLFETIPMKVEIKAPSESRVLAIVNNEIPTRQLDNEVGKFTGETVVLDDSHFRNTEKRVLNISALQQTIAQQLNRNQLTSSEFVIQLMKSPKVFELVNEEVELLMSREVRVEKEADKELIFNKLFR
ncbi:MAG: hypothetical protein AB8G11_11485 [Saprospiraceae bacterium]